MLSILAIALLPAFGVALASDRILVPDDAPTLQEAIDLALSGGTIVVRTGAPQAPIVVDKELTIVGDPEVIVKIGDEASGDCFSPAVTLAGPGQGRVTLSGLRTITGADCFAQPVAIGGGGFDELHVMASDVRAAITGLSGVGFGAPAIQVDLPHVLVSDSTVVGGRDDSDDCVGFLPGGGYPAIASSGVVTVLDSTVRGGGGGLLCCKFGCGCPPSLAGLGGEGGVGLVAAALFSADSTIEGGLGSSFLAYEGDPFVSAFVVCGKQPDGIAMEVLEHVPLAPFLSGSGPLRLGATATLSWNAPPPSVMLFLSEHTHAPLVLPTGGWSFLAEPIMPLGPYPAGGGTQTLSFALPNATSLIGLTVAFQMMDATLTPSRPLVSVIAR